MKLLRTLFLLILLVGAADAPAATWGLVGCSTSDTAAIFYWDWESGQFVTGPPILLNPTGDYPYDAVMRPRGENEVWVCGAAGDGVVVVGLDGAVLHEIPTGEYPVSIAFSPNDGIALVSCRDSDRLDIIDLETYTVTGSLDIPGAGLGPGQLIFDPRGDCFWLAEYYGDMLFRIAPDGSQISAQASIGGSLWQVVVEPNFGGPLYATDRGSDQVRVIDPETLGQIRTVDVGDDPWGMDIDGEKLIVCCEDSHDVWQIDVYDWTVDRYELPADARPRDVNIATGIATIGGKTLLGGAAYVCGGQTAAGSPLYVLQLYDLELLDTLAIGGTNTNCVAVEAQWPLPSPVQDLPAAAALQVVAWPNPFNPQTTVSFTLAAAAEVTVGVFDVAGRLIRRIPAGTLAAGPQSLTWDGRDARGRGLASSSYLIVVQAGDLVAATKVQLVR